MMVRLWTLLALGLMPLALAFGLHSPEFQTLVQDSYRRLPQAPPFQPWLEGAYARAFGGSLERGLAQARAKAAQDPLGVARWAFTLVKKTLPRFSLAEGYEFAYAAQKGERQCLLQSVLIQALLEEAGLEAGVYMVWKNPEGRESNLGHAVAVLRLGGRDYLVDASEPTPFARHQGLFLETPRGYRFAEPEYAPDGAILAYRVEGRRLLPAEVTPLPFAFVRSQFFYYRGEQAAGGVLLGRPPSPTGLARSEEALRQALAIDPANPLARYLLGLTLLKEGRKAEARPLLEEALRLYQSYGHLPEGPKAALRAL